MQPFHQSACLRLCAVLLAAMLNLQFANVSPAQAADNDNATLLATCNKQIRGDIRIHDTIASGDFGICVWGDAYTGGEWVLRRQGKGYIGIGGGGGSNDAGSLERLYRVPAAAAQGLIQRRDAYYRQRGFLSPSSASTAHASSTGRDRPMRIIAQSLSGACTQALTNAHYHDSQLLRSQMVGAYGACAFSSDGQLFEVVLLQRGAAYAIVARRIGLLDEADLRGYGLPVNVAQQLSEAMFR